ncbi:MAG: hypothetical protein KKH44_00420 [Bacteroidetes bacterium]|nr:hypothetical protein [Bacteroidota bacterium]
MKKYEVIVGEQTSYDITANNEIAAENQAWELYLNHPASEIKIRVVEVKQRKENKNAKPRRK